MTTKKVRVTSRSGMVEERQGRKAAECDREPENMKPREELSGPLWKEKGVRYKECRKNQAASSGGYTVDGCREFIPIGEQGTSTGFTCAACSCHRNFHRRELENECDCDSDSSSMSVTSK